MITALRSRTLLIAGVLIAVLAAAFFAMPGSASAHPLGNFTINRYSRIEVYSDVVRVNYVFDMAEIPTFQDMPSIDTDGDGMISDDESRSYAERKSAELVANVSLQLNGETQTLRVAGADAAFPEGQGGLLTTRLQATFEAPAPNGTVSLAYTDNNYSDRVGWREVIVSPATGAALTGTFATEDVSAALTAYPADLSSSPLDVTSAAFSFDAGVAQTAPVIANAPVVAAAPARSGAGFSSLINTDNLSLQVVLLALLAAFAFGAVHAVEPGHGKTMVAAYFVGVKGTARQALGLGLIIAATHTVGVLAIGLLAIFGSQWILPEDLYPWLSLASGLMIIALGLRLIAQRSGGRIMHKISHALPFGHHHHHEHAHAVEATPDGAPPWKSLFAIGLADGLTPSPSALVVLLAAVALDRIGLGIALIVSFSLGLATVLAGISLGLLFFRGAMDGLSRRVSMTRLPFVASIAPSLSSEGIVVRALPMVGATALLVVGVLLTLSALGRPIVSI